MKRWTALILSLIMIFSMTAGLSSFAAAEETKDGHVWETDIRLSITTEDKMRQESGMDLKQWDEALEAAKQAGLADPVSREAMLAADAGAVILEEDGKVYQLGGSSLFGTVSSLEDACRLAYRLAEMLGGSALTDLIPTARLTVNEKTIYSFMQICDGHDVLGTTLKIAADGNNQVLAVFAAIDPEASREQKKITQEEAEAEAAAHASGEVLPGFTDRVFLAHFAPEVYMNMDHEMDDVPSDLAWIVYTAATENAEEYPYEAHYIQTDGTYLRSMPVKEPGDEEARCGARKPDVFTGMTPDTYTGELTDTDGNVRTVTIPVMRSEADGCWYLGDTERRIVFADYYAKVYDEKHELVLVKSEDNKDWDVEDVYAFHNYLQAWQFYADMGWIGPDGEGADVLILKDMCYSDHMSYDNACAMGYYGGWQVFSYSAYNPAGEPTRYTWALDIMAHEYTHIFTSTIMNQNLYQNDPGAINEALSDILGNLVEYICQDTKDTEWLIGENSIEVIRSMTDPEAFAQPEYVWGKYYGPQVTKPTSMNDRGGVHYNSSMLNLIGCKLCTEYGMSYEDAVRLWVMTAAGITPKTDYIQMSTLLPWALEESGESDRYRDALNRLIADTRIDSTGIPETLPEGEKMVRLTLPDTPAFREHAGEWVLFITQYDVKTEEEIKAELLKTVTRLAEDPENRKEFTEDLRTIFENLKMKSTAWTAPTLELDKEKAGDIRDDLLKKLADLLQKTSENVIKGEHFTYSWEEKDTGVIPAVVDDMPSIYLLYNLSKGGSKIEKAIYLLGSSWYDLTDFMMNDMYNDDETAREKLIKLSKELGKQGLRNLLGTLKNGNGNGGKTTDGGITIEELPTTGLEYIVLEEQE